MKSNVQDKLFLQHGSQCAKLYTWNWFPVYQIMHLGQVLWGIESHLLIALVDTTFIVMCFPDRSFKKKLTEVLRQTTLIQSFKIAPVWTWDLTMKMLQEFLLYYSVDKAEGYSSCVIRQAVWRIEITSLSSVCPSVTFYCVGMFRLATDWV